MAAAITATNAAEPLLSVTVSATGLANSTAYVVKITNPHGDIGYKNVTSDGSGAFSFTYVPQAVGVTTYDVRPLAETNGTTTAAATVQGKVKK